MADRLFFGERRLHERKSCVFVIDVDDYNRNYSCHLRNLSLGGVLVEPPPHLNTRVGQQLLLTIPFRRRAGVVVVKGEVVRSNAGRLGIVFLKPGRLTSLAAV